MAEAMPNTNPDSSPPKPKWGWGGARPGAGRPKGSKNGSTPIARERLAATAASAAEALELLGRQAQRYGKLELAHEALRDARRTALAYQWLCDRQREEELAASRFEALKEAAPKPKPEEPAAEAQPETTEKPPSEPVDRAPVRRASAPRRVPDPDSPRWVSRHEQVARIMESMPLIESEYDPYPAEEVR